LRLGKTSERPSQANPYDKNQRWRYERQLGDSDCQLLGRLPGRDRVEVLERLCEPIGLWRSKRVSKVCLRIVRVYILFVRIVLVFHVLGHIRFGIVRFGIIFAGGGLLNR
jgi:hypothetical protein